MHHDDAIADGAVEGNGHEGDANPLDLMRPGLTTLQHASLRLDGDGKYFGALRFEEARHAGKGTSGADSRDPCIDAPLHLLPDLDGGGLLMEVRVGRVLELQRGEGSGCILLELQRLPDGPCHAFGLGCAHYGRAETAHEDAFLF